MALPTNISEATRRLNPQLFPAAIMTNPEPQAGAKKRIRQHQGDGMNKTERAFLEFLKDEFPMGRHYPQTFSVRIANGASYRPDFISVFPTAGAKGVQLSAWETKGFMREAAAVRIKLAASLFPWITFHLVTKQKLKDGGGWSIEEVLP